ncbi:MAG: class I SAM-dependent methyltransferase [Longimicrobiales bacterium]
MTTSMEEVRAYYRRSTEAYLSCMGPTFQAGLVAPEGDTDPYRSNNLYCAERADLREGQTILDAGCGVCGPAMDMSRAVPGARFVGVTLSPEQVSLGASRIREARLEHSVSIQLADFHSLPFSDGAFDRVLFLESLSHSPDVRRALAEAFRVLRPGGLLYVKDLFRKTGLTGALLPKLEGFHRVYALETLPLRDTLETLSALGFSDLEGRSLEGTASTRWMWDVMFETRGGRPRLTRWAELHGVPLEASSRETGDHPDRVFYLAECRARKPDAGAPALPG